MGVEAESEQKHSTVPGGPARSRCCRRRANAGVKIKLPELPLVLAGVLGGPICIFGYTPMRNALTLASQDATLSAMEVYEHTFAGGLSSGWTGGLPSAIAACPEFMVMGPLCHMVKDLTGSSVLAVMASGFGETAITYGPQTQNSQMAFNQEVAREGHPEKQVPVQGLAPWGPGVFVHIARNMAALSGIRVFSPVCQASLARAGMAEGAARQLLGDAIASLGSACLSMPLNQLFNFAVTSADYAATMSNPVACVSKAFGFWDRTYVLRDENGSFEWLTPTLGRDLFLRCAYVATLYISFAAIERIAVSLWRTSGKKEQ